MRCLNSWPQAKWLGAATPIQAASGQHEQTEVLLELFPGCELPDSSIHE